MSTPRTTVITALKWLCIVLFSVLVLVVMWQVFARQVLQAPSTWSTTVSQYLFVWLTLFSVAMVFGERGHVAVDFVVRKLPAGAARIVVVLVQVAIVLFAVLALVWGGLRGVSMAWDQVIPGLPLTVGHMYLALPVAGLLIAAFALEDVLRAARGQDVLAQDDLEEEAAMRIADELGATHDGRKEN